METMLTVHSRWPRGMCRERTSMVKLAGEFTRIFLVLFPTVVSSLDFQVVNSGRTVQYKLNAQSLRLFGLHSDVKDAHRGANRLQNKQNKSWQVGQTLQKHVRNA